MKARPALFAAIVCGTFAVGIVAADVAWGIEVRIDAQGPSGWETVAQSPYDDDISYERYPHGQGCAGPEMRLRVDNDKPFADDIDVRITYWDPVAKRSQVVLDDTWSLESFDSRTHEFTIPQDAFPEENGTDRDPGFEPVLTVDVRVGDHVLGPCVQWEASQ